MRTPAKKHFYARLDENYIPTGDVLFQRDRPKGNVHRIPNNIQSQTIKVTYPEDIAVVGYDVALILNLGGSPIATFRPDQNDEYYDPVSTNTIKSKNSMTINEVVDYLKTIGSVRVVYTTRTILFTPSSRIFSMNTEKTWDLMITLRS